MRTTLTIDDDVAAALREAAHQGRRPFKKVVNEALRAGLARREARARRRYRVKPSSLGGVVPGVNLDKALALADALEDEGIAAKMVQRK
jgi:hypothetical protein